MSTIVECSSSISEFDFDSNSSDYNSSSLFSSSLFSDSGSDFSSEELVIENEVQTPKEISNINSESQKSTYDVTRCHEKLSLKITIDKNDSSKSVSKFIHKNSSPKIPNSSNENKTDLFCDICGEIFLTQALLDIHRLTHTNTGIYTCQICYYLSKSKEEHAFHFRVHNQMNNNPILSKNNFNASFPCVICEKTFRFASSLKRHLENHATAYTCNICNTTFPTELLCHQHKLTHAKNKSHSCQVCNKVFQRRHQLTIHMQVHSDINKQFRCEECNTFYSYKTSLSRHRLKHHSHNTGEFRCDFCGEMFKTRKLLNEHVVLHSAKKLIQCEDCKQTFKHKSSYHRHRSNCHSSN